MEGDDDPPTQARAPAMAPLPGLMQNLTIQTDGLGLGANPHASPPFSPAITPVSTPRDLVPTGPLPYNGDEDLERAIHMAMKNKDTKAWKLLIKARTVRNNLSSTGGHGGGGGGGGDGAGLSAADAARQGEALRPALTKLGWTENEVKWAQARAEGDLVEGIKLLLKDETSAHHQSHSDGDDHEDGDAHEDDEHYQQSHPGPFPPLQQRRQSGGGGGEEAAVTPATLRRLSVDSMWQLLQSTNLAPGDEAARRKAWMENTLLLVEVSSLQRQGRLSLPVKKKMKLAIAQGLAEEVRCLLKMVQQQQPRHHRDSVDREDSLFTSYKCPLTDDLLYEPVTLVCGHTFSKRALEGVLSCGNRKCPICRGVISVADADELKVNILLRDTITRLFSDRILQLVKRDIASLKSENIELAAEELFFIIERYKANEDIVDLAVHTLLTWTREKKNLAPLSRRGLGREVIALLKIPAFQASAKFQRRTALVGMQVLNALGSGSAHGAKVLSDSAIWTTVLSLLLVEKPKVKGAELAALATEAFKMVVLAIKANQESAAVRLDPAGTVHQVLGFVLDNQKDASKEMVAAALHLVDDLLLVAQIKGVPHVLHAADARQIMGLWSAWTAAPEVVREVTTLFGTAIFVQKGGGDVEEDLTSILVQARAVEVGLEALAAFPEDRELRLAVVPLLLRLGFSAGPEANIFHEEVCHQLKDPAFLADVGRYLEGLEERAQQDDLPEDPIVFEKASSSRIDIQENGTQVMANGKGWVVGSAIPAGTLVLTYEVLQEDKGDECSCLGISLAADPPAMAEYRSTGSPFITLRCFSGEIYRDSRVLHASEAFKVHPGGVVRISVDLEAGSLSFQVNDSPSVLVASDLKGRTVYPATYFYLGEAQPDRSTHPIVRMSTTGTQVTKTLAVSVDAALAFSFPPASSVAGRGDSVGSLCSPLLFQEGQVVRRRAHGAGMAGYHEGSLVPSSGSPASHAYCYAVGPGVTSGIHTYVFKATPVLSVCFGVVASDAVEPRLRLGPGPPESTHTTLLVCVWSTGRITSGGLPEGIASIPYDAQDFIKPDEPVTFRLRLEGGDNVVEVVRGGRVIYARTHLDRCLPSGQALHPFVGLLSANDSVSVQYRISSLHALSGEGLLDRKAWTLKAQAVLQELSQLRRNTRAHSLDPPSRLSMCALFQYLEEPSGPYKPILLLEELKVRAHVGGLGADALMDIAWNICRSVSRGVNWESNVREKALQILATLPQAGGNDSTALAENGSGILVRAGALTLVVHSQGGLTPAGLNLLGAVLGAPPCSPALQAYAQELGIVPLLLATMEANVGGVGDRALDLLLLLLQGKGAPLEAVRQELVSLGLYPVLLKHVAARYVQAPRGSRADLFHRLMQVVAGEVEPPEILVNTIVQMGTAVTAASPFLIEPDAVEEAPSAGVAGVAPSPSAEAGTAAGVSTAAESGGGVAPGAAAGGAASPSTLAPGAGAAVAGAGGAAPSSATGSAELLIQRRKVTELQEGWRGYVSKEGIASTSWQDAAFWALKDGDVDMLQLLLATPHFLPFVADRVVFAPAWPGPWMWVVDRPVTLIGALNILAAQAEKDDEKQRMDSTKAFLQGKALAFRRQKQQNMEDHKQSVLTSREHGHRAGYFRYPRADGTMGTFCVETQATESFGFHHNDLVYAAAAPLWGYARVLGTSHGRLWLHFLGTAGAITSPTEGWVPLDLRLVCANRDLSVSGGSTTLFRLPLERGTRVVRGPHWEWGTQDLFPGNVGTVLGNGGGDGWYRVMWDTSHTSNSYQYMPEHQDISRFNDPMENPLAALFPPLASGGGDYVEGPGDEAANEADATALNDANVLGYPAEALAEAGLGGFLGLLHEVWPVGGQDEQQRDLLYASLVRVAIGSPERMDRIFAWPAAEPFIAAALTQMQSVGSEAPLLFLAAATTYSGALDRLLRKEDCLLANAVRMLVAPAASCRGRVLALQLLNAVHHHRPSVFSETMRALAEDSLVATVNACLDHVLNPARNTHAGAHLLAMQFLQRLFAASPTLLSDGGGGMCQWGQVKERFLRLLETYARFVCPKPVMEELLRLLVAWIHASISDGGKPEVEVAEVGILAKALLDEYETVNEILLRAPRPVLLAAPALLQRALVSRGDASAGERAVHLFLRAGTLNVLFQGDYDWAHTEASHVPTLAALLQALLALAPQRKEKIIGLSLVRALLPVLAGCTDADVTSAILQTYASRLPGDKNGGKNGTAAGAEGGSASNGGSSSSSSSKKARPFWAALGAPLTHALCAAYGRFPGHALVGPLALKLLAAVVQETGVLDQEDLDILLSSMPSSSADVTPAAAAAAAEGEDGPVADIVAKLRIVALACRSFETNVQVDTAALVSRVVAWLGEHAHTKRVVEAAMQLLLNLVDGVHVLLPEEVFLSSGSLNTNSLFVTPPRSRQQREQEPSGPALASSGARRRRRGPRGGGGPQQRLRRWHSSSVGLGEMDLALEEHEGDDPGEETGGEGEERKEDDEHSAFGDVGDGAADREDAATHEDEGEEDDGGHSEEEPEAEQGAEDTPVSPADVDSATAQPGWEPTRTRLPHWIQLYLPKDGGANKDGDGGDAGAAVQHQWRALELEQRDFQNSTPKVLEISVGRLPPGASLPLPASALRSVKVLTQTNHRQTGWLSLAQDAELEEGEDVVQVLVSANFGAEEVSTKVGRFRVLVRTRTSVEEIQTQLQMLRDLLPALVGTAVACAEDRSFLRTITLFLRRFYPTDAVRDLPALANSEYDLARGQAAGITFSEDGKRATFPFGPKLLVSALDSSQGILRWVFRSSGNSSWAIGAIPTSKVDRHDVMMAEQSLAVATTGLAGGRISLRKQIQNKKLEAVIDAQAGCLLLTVEDDRDNPIILELPGDLQGYHLAAMGYSGTVLTFLDEL